MTNDDKDLNQAVNTNQTIYRQPTTDYGPEDGNDKGMEPSVFVTKEGAVGFNHYGKCVVKPIKEWVEMAWNTPQQSSEPLKELDEDELFAIISKHNTNNPDRFYNPKEMTNDRQLAIDICERFGQPSEKKALSVEEIARIIGKSFMNDGMDIYYTQHCIDIFAQAIHSALPAQREVRYPEKEYCGKINTALHNDNCEECKYHKLRNKLIDKMKKLNGG